MSATHIRTPDPQIVYAEALEGAIDEAVDALGLDPDEIEALGIYEDEPESHVFGVDPYEAGYDDPEEYAEIVNMVGERDLAAKITHRERILARLREIAAER